jgi:predicted ATPase
MALTSAALLYQLRREGKAAQERVEATITLSTEQGFALYAAWGMSLRGWALTEQGQREEGIVQMRQGLAAYRAMGAETLWPSFLASLAEAYGEIGQAEEGLTVLAEALARVERNGERIYEAELYRLKGQLTLQKLSVANGQLSENRVGTAHHDVTVVEAGTVGGAHPTGDDETETCFLKAVEIARKQQAKSLELRAVMSLSRLWQKQGKKEEARRMLAEIYSWFTEGFDTKDLQEAKALLDELS